MFTNIFYSIIDIQIIFLYSIIVRLCINILINQVWKSLSSMYYKPIFVKESLPIRFGYTDNGSLHIFHTLISFAPFFIYVISYLLLRIWPAICSSNRIIHRVHVQTLRPSWITQYMLNQNKMNDAKQKSIALRGLYV